VGMKTDMVGEGSKEAKENATGMTLVSKLRGGLC